MGRKQVLEQAASLITGHRQETYGDAAQSFARIARLWSVYLGTNIHPEDVAMLMVLLKISRAKTTRQHADSYIDMAGYAALAAEIAGAEL